MRAQRLARSVPVLAALVAVVVWGVGCLDSDRFDHKPPSGQGSIIVDNRTSREINVFINGQQFERVRARRWRAYDLDPGVYRVVLDERHGDRNFRDDIDVLVRRLSVLDVTVDPNRADRFNVFVYFD
jgi:hypothetical protein